MNKYRQMLKQQPVAAVVRDHKARMLRMCCTLLHRTHCMYVSVYLCAVRWACARERRNSSTLTLQSAQ